MRILIVAGVDHLSNSVRVDKMDLGVVLLNNLFSGHLHPLGKWLNRRLANCHAAHNRRMWDRFFIEWPSRTTYRLNVLVSISWVTIM